MFTTRSCYMPSYAVARTQLRRSSKRSNKRFETQAFEVTFYDYVTRQLFKTETPEEDFRFSEKY